MSNFTNIEDSPKQPSYSCLRDILYTIDGHRITDEPDETIDDLRETFYGAPSANSVELCCLNCLTRVIASFNADGKIHLVDPEALYLWVKGQQYITLIINANRI